MHVVATRHIAMSSGLQPRARSSQWDPNRVKWVTRAQFHSGVRGRSLIMIGVRVCYLVSLSRAAEIALPLVAWGSSPVRLFESQIASLLLLRSAALSKNQHHLNSSSAKQLPTLHGARHELSVCRGFAPALLPNIHRNNHLPQWYRRLMQNQRLVLPPPESTEVSTQFQTPSRNGALHRRRQHPE